MAKYVCLSFDDGPNNVPGDNTMNDMLDILEKYQVPASFFLIGNKITEENKKVIRRAFEMGCDIQNHTWTHPFMSKLTKEEMMEEYKKCDDAVTEITGVRPTFFRPPFIYVNDLLHETIPTPFICGHGVEDWVPEVGADERYRRMKEAAKDGIIYLLHVMEGNKATLEACERLIPELNAEGYTFVNLPDLFKLEGVNPKQPKAMWSFTK